MEKTTKIVDEQYNEKKIIIYNEDIDQSEKSSKLLNLPDYLIEAYIFPYLSRIIFYH